MFQVAERGNLAIRWMKSMGSDPRISFSGKKAILHNELTSRVLHLCPCCSLMGHWEYTKSTASGGVWSCPARAMTACFALIHEKTLWGNLIVGLYPCLECTTVAGSTLGPRTDWYFFIHWETLSQGVMDGLKINCGRNLTDTWMNTKSNRCWMQRCRPSFEALLWST